MKKEILIGLAVLGIILIAVVAYLFFFRTPGAPVITGGAVFNVSNEPTASTGSGEQVATNEPVVSELAPKLTQITAGPVATGVYVYAFPVSVPVSGTGTSTAQLTLTETEVRFVERETGNMYSFRVVPKALTRMTNQTLPGVVDAVWSKDGSRAFVRYLSRDTGDTIQSYALGREEGTSYVLEEGLGGIAVTPKGLVFTLLSNSNGSIGTLVSPDGTGAKTLFSSPLSALRVKPAGDSFVAYTKASLGSNGYAFLVDGKTGSFERLVGPLAGLTALPSPSGKKVLLGYRSGSTLRLEILDVATRTSTVLPIATLTEKCVWSADETDVFCAVPRALSGALPDDWYQGAVTFSDRFWKIDVVNRLATLLFDTRELAQIEVDAVSLAIDDTSRVLVFTSKSDGALFAYEL